MNVKNLNVDVSCFENVKSPIELITIRMYNKFETNYKKDNTFVDRGQKNEIMLSFQKVMENCWATSNKNELEDTLGGYEGTIQRLSSLASASDLYSNFSKLSDIYIKIFDIDNLTINFINLNDNYKEKYKHQFYTLSNMSNININDKLLESSKKD